MRTPTELHELGVAAYNRGRHAGARRSLERALSLHPDPDLTARIEVSLAYVLAETGSAPEALELCRHASTRPELEPATRGVVHGQSGLLHMLQGQGDEALRHFDLAAELLTDERERGRVLLNRGNVHLQRHQLAPAADDFAAAERHFESVADGYAAAKARHNLGYVHLLAGDLVAALDTMAAAYPVFAREGPVLTAMADQDRAEALLAAGLVQEGRSTLLRASRDYGRRRLYQRQGEAELALARAAVESDPRLALAAGRRARDRFRRNDATSWRLRAEAEILAAQVQLGRVPTDVATRGGALAEGLAESRLRWNATGVRLQVVRGLLARGDLAGARDRLRGIRVTGAAPLAVRLAERDVRAAVAQAAGHRSAALSHLRAGLGDLHAWQSSFGSLDLQTNVVGHGVRLATRGLALAVESPSAPVLFEWSERARMLASRVQPVRAPLDEQVAADLEELRAQPEPGREAELRRGIRERAWQLAGSGQVADPVTLRELRAALDARTALVAHVVTPARVVALVVTDEGAVRHDLGDRASLDGLLGGLQADLDTAATDLPESLAAVVRGELGRRLGDLADRLVAPLLPDLGGTRVVLTPSSVLAGVPWSLLPGLTGRPVTVAQSATSWLARSATPLRARSAGLVAGPRVARAEAEVRAVARAWPGAEVLTGDGATAGAVTELAGRVDVLHVAAHGRHSAENPLFSGLELVGGPWFGYDIDRLAAVPDVVLLSACEVGRSSVRSGEELIGMTAAWLHAGARCVVASAAAVSDEVAHDVLVALHRGLAAGLAPDAALAAAVPPVLAERPPAPFVCFG